MGDKLGMVAKLPEIATCMLVPLGSAGDCRSPEAPRWLRASGDDLIECWSWVWQWVVEWKANRGLSDFIRYIPWRGQLVITQFQLFLQGAWEVDQQCIISGVKQGSQHLNKKTGLPVIFFLEQTKKILIRFPKTILIYFFGQPIFR